MSACGCGLVDSIEEDVSWAEAVGALLEAAVGAALVEAMGRDNCGNVAGRALCESSASFGEPLQISWRIHIECRSSLAVSNA